VYYDENITRMVMNYRSGFLRLAENAMRTEHNPEKAKKIMARMEEVIPLKVVPNQDWRYTYEMMDVSSLIGDEEHSATYSKALETQVTDLLKKTGNSREQDQMYSALIGVYERNQNYGAAIDILNLLQAKYPDDPGIRSEIQRYENLMKTGSKPDTSKK
jgi:hypothetical protein